MFRYKEKHIATDKKTSRAPTSSASITTRLLEKPSKPSNQTGGITAISKSTTCKLVNARVLRVLRVFGVLRALYMPRALHVQRVHVHPRIKLQLAIRCYQCHSTYYLTVRCRLAFASHLKFYCLTSNTGANGAGVALSCANNNHKHKCVHVLRVLR